MGEVGFIIQVACMTFSHESDDTVDKKWKGRYKTEDLINPHAHAPLLKKYWSEKHQGISWCMPQSCFLVVAKPDVTYRPGSGQSVTQGALAAFNCWHEPEWSMKKKWYLFTLCQHVYILYILAWQGEMIQAAAAVQSEREKWGQLWSTSLLWANPRIDVVTSDMPEVTISNLGFAHTKEV